MLADNWKASLLSEQLDQSHTAGGILDDGVRHIPLGGKRYYSLLHFEDGPVSAIDMQQIQLPGIDPHQSNGRVVILGICLAGRIARQNHAAEFLARRNFIIAPKPTSLDQVALWRRWVLLVLRREIPAADVNLDLLKFIRAIPIGL